MQFVEAMVHQSRPDTLAEVNLPRREAYHASPVDWSEEVLYFLLPDRFSDEDQTRPLIDRNQLQEARAQYDGANWNWENWVRSGAAHFQGGTIKGISSRMGYLKKLGITAIWVGPIFKQRANLDTYHGYGIQDFLEVDPRFGSRADLVNLVKTAHDHEIRVILDIIFNHSGFNFFYAPGTPGKDCGTQVSGMDEAIYTFGQHPEIRWQDQDGKPTEKINNQDDGVWPKEFGERRNYTRAGTACEIGWGDIGDPNAVHKRTDFFNLRDLNLAEPGVLTNLAKVYQYWIALTDCDGFRIDTMKHVTWEQAKNFCGAIKEFAQNIGKHNFLLVAEVAGGDYGENYYLNALGQNLDAALDIGEMKGALNRVAKGLLEPQRYFSGFYPGAGFMGSHRELRNKHVSILEQHDDHLRFSTQAASDHQVVAGTAIQLFTLGIPCIYYGTEQALTGGPPEQAEWQWLWKQDWMNSDRYTREAMFGPLHPRKQGKAGFDEKAPGTVRPEMLDTGVPGFGPFGTAGYHCFDENSPTFLRIASLIRVRQKYPVLRYGRQYLRGIHLLEPELVFDNPGPGEIVAWSRILNDEEVLIVVNSNGHHNRGGDILVDSQLCPPGTELTVIANTEEAATPTFRGAYRVGDRLTVKQAPQGSCYIEIRDVKPSEVIVLANHP